MIHAGIPIYKGMRLMMFQLSSFYCIYLRQLFRQLLRPADQPFYISTHTHGRADVDVNTDTPKHADIDVDIGMGMDRHAVRPKDRHRDGERGGHRDGDRRTTGIDKDIHAAFGLDADTDTDAQPETCADIDIDLVTDIAIDTENVIDTKAETRPDVDIHSGIEISIGMLVETLENDAGR